MLRVLERQLSLTQVSLIQQIIILPLAMWMGLAVPKMSLCLLRWCQLPLWWEIEFSRRKGENRCWLWLQNSEGQKEKGRDIQPSRWVFPEISPTDTFIMIALRVAFFSCHFFNCCLLGFLRFRRLSGVFTSAPNLPPNYRAWRSNSASFHLKSVFIWIQFSAEAKAELWSLLDH